MKTMVKQAVPLQPMEVRSGADLHLQPVERTPSQSRWMPEGGSDPVGSPHRSKFAGRACEPMGDTCWSSLFLKDCTPWKGPTLGQFYNSCTRAKDPQWKSLWRTVSRERDPTLEQPQSVRSPCPEGQGAAETTCDELTAAPIPRIPLCRSGGGGRQTGVKLSPGRREG